MLRHTWCCYALLGLMISHVILASPIADRPTQLIDISELNPTYEEGEIIDENTREKRKIGLIKIGATSAIIGLLFGKINSLIDSKTNIINTLDRTNIEKNKALGIEAPKNNLPTLPVVDFSALSNVISSKLQFLAPKIQFLTSKLAGGSGSGSASISVDGESSGGGSGNALGGIINLVSSFSSSSSQGSSFGDDDISKDD